MLHNLFVTSDACVQAKEALSEAHAAAEKAYGDLQAQLHAMQAELDAARTDCSASAQVPGCSYQRVSAGLYSVGYAHLASESIWCCMHVASVSKGMRCARQDT